MALYDQIPCKVREMQIVRHAKYVGTMHALQYTTAGPYNKPSTLLGVGSVCGLGPDLVGIRSLSIAARYRVAACSTTLSRGLEKISTAKRHNCTPFFAMSLLFWEKEFLVPSMAYCSVNAFDIFSFGPWWHTWRNPKGRKLHLACFWTKFINKTLLDFFLVVLRESRDRSIVIVLLTSNSTRKVSRVLLALGYLLTSFASSVTGSVLHRDFTLKDMITPSVLDAQMNLILSLITMSFPGCTLKHLQDSETSGKFWWLHERKDSLYDGHHFLHTSTRVRQRVLLNIYLVSHFKTSGCPSPNPDVPYFPNARSITREKGNDYRGWLFVQMVALVVDGELLAGWSVIKRSLRRRIDVMFGPVVNTEAHPAVSGARTHSNNTAVMTAMIEALSFLGHHGFVVRDKQSCIYFDSLHAVGVCFGTIQARTHVQLALACQKSMIFVQRKLRLTMKHVYGHNGNLGDECADHAVALGTWGITSRHNVATRCIHHYFDATACLMAVTALMRSWNVTGAFERILGLFPIRISFVFAIGFFVLFVHFTWLSVVCVFCPQHFSRWVLASVKKWWTDFLHPRLPSTTCGILHWNYFSSSRKNQVVTRSYTVQDWSIPENWTFHDGDSCCNNKAWSL